MKRPFQSTQTNHDVESAEQSETTPWLQHTRWPELFRNRPLDIIAAAARQPKLLGGGSDLLGRYQGSPLWSSAETEAQLRIILQGLDLMFDRARATVDRTPYMSRCWLNTYSKDTFWPHGFRIIPSFKAYLAIWKRFICFVFRVLQYSSRQRREIFNLRLGSTEMKMMQYILYLVGQLQLERDEFHNGLVVANHEVGDKECQERRDDCGVDSDSYYDSDLEDLEADEDSDADTDREFDDNTESEEEEEEEEDAETDQKTGGDGSDFCLPSGHWLRLSEALFQLSMMFWTHQDPAGNMSSSVIIYFTAVMGIQQHPLAYSPAHKKEEEVASEASFLKAAGDDSKSSPEASVHLRQILEREEGYRDAMNQPRITSKDSGSETFAATSLWLERTQWPSMYQNARRDILRALTRLPNRQSLTTDYILGQGTLEGDADFTSPHEDEQKISCIMGALDSVIDRCEDTVRHTSRTLLCWLLSSRLQSPREIPFGLVAERNTELRYRQIEKKLLAFTFGQQIWNHRVWDLFDTSKGLWPRMESQSCYGGIGETLDDAPISDDRSNRDACDVLQDGEGIHGDRQDEEEDDGDDDDGDVEDWELEDDEDDYDDDDPGYDSDLIRVEGKSAKPAFDEFHELLFQLCLTLCTETFIDGQPGSTLLVYFSGVLGFSGDCRKFLLARQYCPQLSAIIHIQRILLLERALPLRPYPIVGIPQRPRTEQLETLNKIREKYMVLGSQSPVAELVSLRDFGRNAARTEPPSTLFHWSSDGEAVSDGTLKLTMREFRKLPEYFISRAEALCDSLMFGMKPDVDLSKIKDDMASSESGYCFVEHPGNGLKSAYLDLLVQAYTSSKNGLARGGTWKWHAVVSYLKRVAEMEEQLAGGLHTACGQTPRVRELFSLECENGPSTTCGVYVWACYMVYVIRHHKAKRLTNREFYVVRFLPVRLGRVLYLYLVYIRKLANLLRREQVGYIESHQERTQTRLLFHSNGKAWPTSRLTGILTKATLEVWKQAVHVRLYRQLAVAVTEKHVREVYTPFNRYDDYSSDADVNVVFAWQSGHRPLQRGTQRSS
ncbi:hypothetical protein MRS44_018702 [Fusarium solani]|uniref:uncharacterized protein n=1 Tax=Fusarium solani TaxID=169388 RepID=UPI0032C48FDC|nr:hypothetical protein MRS44_018702 [Fusarium solani]